MNRKKTFLDDCYLKRNHSDIIVLLQNYYAMKDLDESKNFLGIFNALYVSEEQLTYDEIAIRYYVGINTLKRYVVKFNRLAMLIAKSKK